MGCPLLACHFLCAPPCLRPPNPDLKRAGTAGHPGPGRPWEAATVTSHGPRLMSRNKDCAPTQEESTSELFVYVYICLNKATEALSVAAEGFGGEREDQVGRRGSAEGESEKGEREEKEPGGRWQEAGWSDRGPRPAPPCAPCPGSPSLRARSPAWLPWRPLSVFLHLPAAALLTSEKTDNWEKSSVSAPGLASGLAPGGAAGGARRAPRSAGHTLEGSSLAPPAPACARPPPACVHSS